MRNFRYAAAFFAVAASAQTLSFDVASIKPNNADPRTANSNFPPGPGDVYVPNGGYLNATNFPLFLYILFAYKLQGNQVQYLQPQLPSWVMNERFDIQARASGNPTKDDMRMMMRSLLAERFKFKIHIEKRDLPVLAFVLAKPGTLGPSLRLHADDSSCPTTASSPDAPASKSTAVPGQIIEGGFPALCNGIFNTTPKVDTHIALGGRNVTLAFIADAVSAGAGLGRPMVDQTGVAAKVDFLIEFTPQPRGTPAAADDSLDTLSITQALREQLGIKLESKKAPMDVLVVDHIEHPSEN